MKENINNRSRVSELIKWKTCLSLFLMLSLIVISGTGCGKEEKIYLDGGETSLEEAQSQKKGSQTEDEREEDSGKEADQGSGIFVYVCGAVNHPGVYELESGMRICDALEAAGGFREDAASESLNQAEPVSDGQMVRVPVTGEEGQGQAGEPAAEGDGRININTADAQELMQLPGIGASRAEAIIAYRQEHGAFTAVEDLMKISGIKEGVFQKMKDSVTVN